VADKFDVRKYIQLRSRVLSAEWSEAKGKWLVKVQTPEKTFIDEANFIVTATGHFSDPRLPDYPGIREFQGHLRHSSNWDPSFDPTGKRVAVIGNGASGIQVTPQLQKVASHVDHYARNKTWVAASFGGEGHAQFVADNIDKARESPENYVKFRKELESSLFSRFGGIFKDTAKNRAARETITELMTSRLAGRQDLAEAIIPDFAPNCRRLTPGPGYLEALAQDNVSYITTPIEKFTATGIVTTDGKNPLTRN
jgi:cation diffusion facilitator CzcD-associated flavoprotein CzcO